MSVPIPIPKRYFINDIICRVTEFPRIGFSGGGTAVDIGIVEFPSKTQGHREFIGRIQNGFTDEFYVTWGHSSYIPDVREKKMRELVHATDDKIFLLDRELSPGMYVRKRGDNHSIGLVRAVDVFTSVSLLPAEDNQVASDVEIRTLERNWESEDIMGSYVMLNEWIGQVVEVKKSAVLCMEKDSEFVISWDDSMSDSDNDITGKEMHHRFSTVGDTARFSTFELATEVKWISAPADKNWHWPIRRPFEYDDKPAVVQKIIVHQIRIIWIENLPSTCDKIFPRPIELFEKADYEELIRQGRLQCFMLTLPEAKTVGDTVFLRKNFGVPLEIQTYDRWANTYLREMKIRSQIIEPRDEHDPPPTKKSKTDSSYDSNDERLFYFRAVQKFQSITPGIVSVPGKVICRRSRVAVQWSMTSIESLPSTELTPVLYDKSIGLAPGTVVKSLVPPTVFTKDSAEYGVVTKIDNTNQENKITATFYKIPVETNVPVQSTVQELSASEIILHPLYNFRPGNIVMRISPYDEFLAGIYLGAIESGELVTATPDGNILKVWPNRVKKICKKAEFDNDTEEWRIYRDHGQKLEFSRPLSLKHLMPSSWSLSSCFKMQFTSKIIKMIEGDCAKEHHYARMLELHPIVDGRIDQILKDEGAALAILPEGIWFKCSSQRKNLLFAAMEGPEGTIYEDCLFFFDIRLDSSWPSWEIGPYVFFNSFFDYPIVPDFKSDGRIIFESTLAKKDVPRYPRPPNSQEQNLGALFLEIREVSLKAEPRCFPKTVGDNIVSSIFNVVNKGAEKRINNAQALTKVAKSIRIQLLNLPFAWQEEIMAYYMIHIPKFCGRVGRWAMGHQAFGERPSVPNFPLLPMEKDNMVELLKEIQKLLAVYNSIF